MDNLIIGNIVALIASIVMVYYGFLTDKKKILFYQSVQIGLFVISGLILGGITGVIINIVNLIRNILCYIGKLGLKEKIIITTISTFLCLKFNNLGVLGLLPLISTVVYIWLMNIKDEIKFKILTIGTMIPWFIYDMTIKSYTSAIFSIFNIFASVITVYKMKR